MPTCSNCDKFFSSSSSYKYHITHKVCEKTHAEHRCPNCQNIFTTKRMCQYHIDHNVCQKDTKMKLTMKTPTKQRSVAELEEEIAQLKGENKALKENPQTVNNNNNIIVFPKEFGKEDMQHVKEILGDVLKPLLMKCPARSIPFLFDTIHKNDKLPEYHNVYIANERSRYAMVSDGKKFEYKSKKEIIEQIIEDKRSILNQYVNDYGERLGEKVLEKYARYCDNLDGDPEIREDLEVEISAMLLNMKSVIANDEKTRKLLSKVDDTEGDLVS